MERIPTPDFGQPVCWLRVGDVQLHLLLDPEAAPRSAPPRPDDRRLRRAPTRRSAPRADVTFGWSLVELPSGQVQLYFRDPGGNLIELNWPDVETLDRSKYPELTRLADQIPQSAEALRARLYLAPAKPARRRPHVRFRRTWPRRDVEHDPASVGPARACAPGAGAPRQAHRDRPPRLVLVFPVIWVLFLAPTTGKYATSFGSAVHDPKDFLITLVNGVTDAGLYFVVASGFTLIFGLMRVVNMAHGAFFLLGGYIALKIQRHMVGEGGAFGLTSEPGQPDPLDRPGDRRHPADRRRSGWRCSRSSCAGTRARTSGRR